MKKTIRALLCLMLVLALALSLCACGDNKPEQQTGEQEDLSTKMVYTAQYTNLKQTEDQDTVSPSFYTDDGFYGTMYSKIGENIPEGVTPEYEGQYDVWGNSLYFVGFDGKMRKLEAYEPMPALENPGDYQQFYSGSSLSNIFPGENGQLIALENVYANWYDGPENLMNSDQGWEYYKNSNEYYIRTLDDTGAEISCVKVDYDNPEGYLEAYNARMDSDGNMVFTSDGALYAYGPDGSLAYHIEMDTWVDSLIVLPDGRLCAAYWGDRGMALRPADPATRSLGTEIALPNQAYNLLPGNSEYDLFYSNGSSLMGYKIDTEESEKILTWLDCDLNGDRISGLHVNEDGSILGVYNTFSETASTSELVRLTKVPANTLPQKETITMAGLYFYEMRDKIIDFNRHSDTVRIQLTDYSEFNDVENGDYDIGRTKLLTEIMAGNMPDILSLSEMPYSQLAAKGLLEDLYPYLDADPELNRDDFFPSILKAMEVDGKLCQVSSGFQIATLIGASSVVGDTPGWNYQQFAEALATMPEGCDPLEQYVTRSDILSTLLYLDLDEYVDWSTGKCNFDSPDFVELLNFVAQFRESYDWEHYEYSEEDNTQNRIASGRQMLAQIGIYDFTDLQYNEMYFNGPITYIGYPTTHGVGHVLTLSSGLAMSSACKNKEAAWSFLREIMTEEYQESTWGLPINLDAYNTKLEKAMTPEYERDENGNFRLDEEGNKIEVSRGGWSTGDGEIHYIYAMTQEQADQLRALIDSVDSVMDQNSAIFDIVNEQAAAFFAGQKSAEEVARLIQSRASIYVNEQR